MYKEVENIFEYDEIRKFMFAYLKSNNIDYQVFEKQYSTSPAYGIDIQHMYTKISHLPAPFGIGNIEIHIIDDRIAFRYVTYYKRYFDPSDELGYELYGPEVNMMQDFWYIMVPGLDFDDYSWDYKYGGLEGCQINSHTIKYIIEFLNKIFVEHPFVCSPTIKEKAIEYINQFDDYSKNYSKTAYGDFLETVGSIWYVDKWLWSTIPFMTHRCDDIDKADIKRSIGIR